MNTETIIAASVLGADLKKIGHETEAVLKAGANWLHLDIMDGSFVPPITFGTNMVTACRGLTTAFLDVHLMIIEPERHFSAFRDAGADRIIVHQEVSPHLHRSLTELQKLGMQNGVALNPATPVTSIEHVLEVADLILVMSVNPGWGGQKFLPHTLHKIEHLKEIIEKKNLPTLIEVDGGINDKTAKLCRESGADVLVAGSYIFSSDNRAKAIQSLKQ